MRTTIEIDDRLMKEAMEATGLKTKRAVVIHAMEELIRQRPLLGRKNKQKNYCLKGGRVIVKELGARC